MIAYRIDLRWHAWRLRSCLAAIGGQASLDLETFEVEVRARERCYRLYPRFIDRQGDRIAYGHRPVRALRSFAGWLPYTEKRWPAGSGKFAFKEFCAEHGIATPAMWRTPQAEMREFLIKHDLSSSCSGMRGPFAGYDGRPAQQLQPGGYYEQFVRGELLKAWFWEERLVGVELLAMPTVEGDGKSSLRELIVCMSHQEASSLNWEVFGDIAAYQGLPLDEVLAAGRTVLADYRYISPLIQVAFNSEPPTPHPLWTQLAGMGSLLASSVPPAMREATLLSVDGIVDSAGKIWFLEMNCNPAVHPDAYEPMMARLFGEIRQEAPLVLPAPQRLPAAAARVTVRRPLQAV